MRYLLTFLCAATAFVTAQHAVAQQRVVMPDRQSIELSGQISALKSLLEEALQQNHDLAKSLENLHEAADVSITHLEMLIANLGGGSVSATQPGLTEQEAWGDYLGQEISCDIDNFVWAYGAPDLKVYARISTKGVPQVKVEGGEWLDGESRTSSAYKKGDYVGNEKSYTYSPVNVSFSAYKNSDGYYQPSKMTGTATVKYCKKTGAWGMCSEYGTSSGECSANW